MNAGTHAPPGISDREIIHTLLQSVADRDAAQQMGYNPGWTQSLERLAEYVAQV